MNLGYLCSLITLYMYISHQVKDICGVYVRAHVCERVCACVCACVSAYMYMYMCMSQ